MFNVGYVEQTIRRYGDGFRHMFMCETCQVAICQATFSKLNWRPARPRRRRVARGPSDAEDRAVGKPARSALDRLRDELGRFASGQDRRQSTVTRIANLVDQVDGVPWREELLFVVGHYSPYDEASGEEALAGLAQLVLGDWPRKRAEPRWRLALPDDAKGLHRRWLDASGRERAEGVVRNLETGRFGDLAFGVYDGRLDLRGFQDPREPGRSQWTANLDHVDFSGARFNQLHFMRSTVVNSRFDGVSFGDFRMWSSTVTSTSFRGTKFGDFPVLDGVSRWPRRCTFRQVDFSRANLSGLTVRSARFEDCDFSEARLNRALFGCDLVRCRFAGHLCDVTFRGRRPGSGRRLSIDAVDLSRTELHHVGFRAVDLSAFRLPLDPNLRVVSNWPCVRDRLSRGFAGRAANEVPLSVRFALIPEAGGLPPNGSMVLELGTFRENDSAEGVAEVGRLLDRLEAECVQTKRPIA